MTTASSVQRLVDRDPQVPGWMLLDALVPPPSFAAVSFDSYCPDPDEPTQAAAVAAVRAFSVRLGTVPERRRRWRRTPAPSEVPLGVYLDGGFGVGKTHLLAAMWHSAPEPKAFATFVELAHVVGAIGFNDAAARLSGLSLLCIDEFELDDPGDTMLMSTLLTRLTEAGVRLGATSNTLPDRLGEGRFAAADFLREIHGLAAHFDVIRIDGPDYRHRGTPTAAAAASDEQIDGALRAARAPVVDDFEQLIAHLAGVHPSRYGVLVDGVDLVVWRDVRSIEDQAMALRFVVLVDRLYDRSVGVIASGIPLDEVFNDDLLRGGYRKKYFRALSRLTSLAARSGD